MWGVDLNELSTSWIYKLPKTDLKSILHSIILKKANKKNLPSHDYFYYPKSGGFQRIVNAIYEPVRNHVKLSYKIDSILTLEIADENGVSFNGWCIDKQYRAKNIINTAPWESLLRPMGANMFKPFFEKFLPGLKYTSLDVTYKKRTYKTDAHWTYIPDLDIEYHRVFYVNNYAPSNPDSYLMTETNNLRVDSGYINPNYVFLNKYAYPIPLKSKNKAMKDILTHYDQWNFYGLGRWGTWQHHNSDVCIFEAMELLNRLENTRL